MEETYDAIAGEHQGSLAGYATGFLLSLILTAIPFGLVMTGILPRAATLFGIAAAAVVQILVHLHYFLHMDRSSSQRWNLMTFLFAALVMTIFIGGTLWIMFDLHYRMMG
jgi:cytochrome o ubiquinol oxidase operon protein cyoD